MEGRPEQAHCRAEIDAGRTARRGKARKTVDSLDIILDLIDARSFSSLWYWIILAAFWGISGHWVLGVPISLLAYARRHGGDAVNELDHMAHLQSRATLRGAQSVGPGLVGAVSFLASLLIVLGLVMGLELAQALLLLVLPLPALAALRIRAARQIHGQHITGEDLIEYLYMLRMRNQLVGIAAIAVTVLWGMVHNMMTLAIAH